jgi:hypothetical protein
MTDLNLPIELPDIAIKEFQDLMMKHYQLNLSFDEAKKQARRLMAFFMVVFQPIKKYG